MINRLRRYFNKQRLKTVIYMDFLRRKMINTKLSEFTKSRGFLLSVYLIVMVGLAGLWWWNSPYRLGNNPINLPDSPPVTHNPPLIIDNNAPPEDDTTQPSDTKPQVEDPVVEEPEPEEIALPALSLNTAVDKITKPVQGAIIAPFGFKWSKTYEEYRWRHGVGIATTQGTPVVAAYAGRVLSVVEKDPEWGSKVTIEHGSGWKTIYASVAKVSVSPGNRISKGQQIGEVGPNPPALSAEGPALYFALYEGEESVDPTEMFK